MIASRRRWHYRAWLVLVPLTLIGLLAAIALRPTTPVSEARTSGAAP